MLVETYKAFPRSEREVFADYISPLDVVVIARQGVVPLFLVGLVWRCREACNVYLVGAVRYGGRYGRY